MFSPFLSLANCIMWQPIPHANYALFEKNIPFECAFPPPPLNIPFFGAMRNNFSYSRDLTCCEKLPELSPVTSEPGHREMMDSSNSFNDPACHVEWLINQLFMGDSIPGKHL